MGTVSDRKNYGALEIWYPQGSDGILIKDMDQYYLLNCIDKILRDKWRVTYLPVFLAELKSRGLDKKYPEYFI